MQPGEDKDDDEFIVMLDPAGHPFCFVHHHEPWDGPVGEGNHGGPSIVLRMPFIDSPDHRALAAFYTNLLDAPPIGEDDDEYVAIGTGSGTVLGFQRVEGYQPPTWPTQERGQQLHFDIRVDDLDAGVKVAESNGAAVAFRGEGHIVMLDPAGHPFCLGAG